MAFRTEAAALTLMATIAMPCSAWAFTGVGGCSGLPEYYRALGALQPGMSGVCEMSVERARSIVSAYDGPAAVAQPVAPSARPLHRRRRPRHP